MLRSELETKVTPQDLGITPEEEFWAHASNLQAWMENDYDPRLLDTRLSLPLIKELSELGDPVAQKRLHQAIMERYAYGDEKSRMALLEYGFLDNLTRAEELSFIEDSNDFEALLELEEALGEEFHPEYKCSKFKFNFKDGKITELHLPIWKSTFRKIPECIGNFSNLETLILNVKELAIAQSQILLQIYRA